MKCSKCEKDFDIKDVTSSTQTWSEDAMEREMNNLYFECPECDTPLVMTYTLQED